MLLKNLLKGNGEGWILGNSNPWRIFQSNWEWESIFLLLFFLSLAALKKGMKTLPFLFFKTLNLELNAVLRIIWRIFDTIFNWDYQIIPALPCGSAGKESSCNVGDLGSIPGLGKLPGKGNGYWLQYSGLENSMMCIVSVQFSSATKPSLTLCEPTDCSTPGFPVHHQLLELIHSCPLS